MQQRIYGFKEKCAEAMLSFLTAAMSLLFEVLLGVCDFSSCRSKVTRGDQTSRICNYIAFDCTKPALASVSICYHVWKAWNQLPRVHQYQTTTSEITPSQRSTRFSPNTRDVNTSDVYEAGTSPVKQTPPTHSTQSESDTFPFFFFFYYQSVGVSTCVISVPAQ